MTPPNIFDDRPGGRLSEASPVSPIDVGIDPLSSALLIHLRAQNDEQVAPYQVLQQSGILLEELGPRGGLTRSFHVQFRERNGFHFASAVLQLFPYVDEGWRDVMERVFAFEDTCWTRWCHWTEQWELSLPDEQPARAQAQPPTGRGTQRGGGAQRDYFGPPTEQAAPRNFAEAGSDNRGERRCLGRTGRPAIFAAAPTWWALQVLLGSGVLNLGTPNQPIRLPYLFRPYLPWVSLQERRLPNAWFENLKLEFLDCVLPEVVDRECRLNKVPESMVRQWTQDSNGRWVPEDPPRLRRWLSDGLFLVPTRWRDFHKDFHSLGERILAPV